VVPGIGVLAHLDEPRRHGVPGFDRLAQLRQELIVVPALDHLDHLPASAARSAVFRSAMMTSSPVTAAPSGSSGSAMCASNSAASPVPMLLFRRRALSCYLIHDGARMSPPRSHETSRGHLLASQRAIV